MSKRRHFFDNGEFKALISADRPIDYYFFSFQLEYINSLHEIFKVELEMPGENQFSIQPIEIPSIKEVEFKAQDQTSFARFSKAKPPSSFPYILEPIAPLCEMRYIE